MLAQLGVRVVVSVDGGKPKTELARKHGLRYVHLPIGYDGVPAIRVAELVKTASTAEGPIYVHCHHGKHRGPAAAAVICRGIKKWNTEEAARWLTQAGTGSEYAGLHRDVRNFQKPAAERLAAVPDHLPEIAETPAAVDRMVALDDYLDALKSAQQAGWHPANGNPSPHETATLLWEELRELGREPDTEKRGPEHRQLLNESMAAADRLRGHLIAGKTDALAAEKALKALSASCIDCHKEHRQ